MRIVSASDHAGLELKLQLIGELEALGHHVEDVGTHTSDSCDYPDFAAAASARLLAGEADRVLLVCGTGQGMAMTANRRSGVRCAVVSDVFSARMARAHNDANTLAIGARVVGAGLAWEIVRVWVETPFEGDRHLRRVQKIDTAGAAPA